MRRANARGWGTAHRGPGDRRRPDPRRAGRHRTGGGVMGRWLPAAPFTPVLHIVPCAGRAVGGRTGSGASGAVTSVIRANYTAAFSCWSAAISSRYPARRRALAFSALLSSAHNPPGPAEVPSWQPDQPVVLATVERGRFAAQGMPSLAIQHADGVSCLTRLERDRAGKAVCTHLLRNLRIMRMLNNIESRSTCCTRL